MRGVSFCYGEVSCIDTLNRTITTEYQTLHYDILVIAAGTTNNFFDIENLRQRVCTLKSTSQAIRTRNEILLKLERAAIEHDPDLRRRLLTFAVIGGGPTGVEIAGALGEMKRYVIAREYPSISPDEVRVILAEGSGRLLHTMSEASSEDALRDLRKLMVDVRLNKTMRSYDENDLITFTDGDTIEAGTQLTYGALNPHDVLRIRGADAVYNYLIQEVLRVYRQQGVDINDKHIEVIVRQMMRKVRVEDAGDSNLLSGSTIDIIEFRDACAAIRQRTEAGETREDGEPLVLPTCTRLLLGITKASLATESFLSAASFQETTKVLTEAAIKGKVDHLLGLKENVIIGKLIPAGSGLAAYRKLDEIEDEVHEENRFREVAALADGPREEDDLPGDDDALEPDEPEEEDEILSISLDDGGAAPE